MTWRLEDGDRMSEYYGEVIAYPIPFVIFKPGLGVPKTCKSFFSYAKTLFESDINFMTGDICSESMYYRWTIKMFPHKTDSGHGSRILFLRGVWNNNMVKIQD